MDTQKASARPHAGEVVVAQTQLQAGALGLVPVLMQGVTHIAPAVGLVLTIQFIASQAGVTAPLAYFIAFLIVMTLGIALIKLARHLPSAGGYYTYVSKTIGPRAGFLTAWLYFLYDPTGAAINIAVIYVGYKSIVPLPSMPVGAAPYLVAVWLVAGAVLVWVMSRTGKEEWLVKAGETAHEVPAASGTQPTPVG